MNISQILGVGDTSRRSKFDVICSLLPILPEKKSPSTDLPFRRQIAVLLLPEKTTAKELLQEERGGRSKILLQVCCNRKKKMVVVIGKDRRKPVVGPDITSPYA